MERIKKIFGGDKNYLFISIILTITGFGSVTIFDTLWALMLFICLSCGFGLSRMVGYISIADKSISSSRRATVNSFINMFKSMVIAVFNPIIGFLADMDINNAFLVLIMTGFVSIIINIYVSKYIDESY